MMIQHLAVTTHNVVKAERRPRRNIQYRDVSGAVGKTDNLEFLVDVVPRTMQYGVYRKRKAAEDEAVKDTGDKEGQKGKARENGALVGGVEREDVAAVATPAPLEGVQLDPLARKELVPPVPETEAMDVDGAAGERVADSEGEEDPAAMQIEMEMRGPPRVGGNEGTEEEKSAPEPTPAPVSAPAPAPAPPRMSSGGFTAINGR